MSNKIIAYLVLATFVGYGVAFGVGVAVGRPRKADQAMFDLISSEREASRSRVRSGIHGIPVKVQN